MIAVPDTSLVATQLARIAAEAEGHKPGCSFILRPGGVIACSCGEFAWELTPVPVQRDKRAVRRAAG